MGKWYQAVNNRVSEAQRCRTAKHLVRLLGPPDEVSPSDKVNLPSSFFARIGSILRFGDEQSDSVMTYVDPYRPNRRYRFGVVAGKIQSVWQDTTIVEHVEHHK